jgi:hypothetical protein
VQEHAKLSEQAKIKNYFAARNCRRNGEIICAMFNEGESECQRSWTTVHQSVPMNERRTDAIHDTLTFQYRLRSIHHSFIDFEQ